MYHGLLRTASFWEFLFTVDERLAEEAREAGCPCGGPLHRANYPRQPRGGCANLPESYGHRLSFCCARDGCRKRTTPPSVRFLGRKVFLGAVVVLVAAMRHGAVTPARPGADRVVRSRPADHRTLVHLLARAVSPNPILETGPRSFRAETFDRRVAPGVVGGLRTSGRLSRAVGATAGVSLSDHDHGGPGNRGNFLKNSGPQRMLVELPDGPDQDGLTVVLTFVYSIREEL